MFKASGSVGEIQARTKPILFLSSDTIVNATSSWPLNSLNPSIVPNFEENMNYTYFDRDHYLNHSKSHSKDRKFTVVSTTSLARDETAYQPFTSEHLRDDNTSRTIVATFNNNILTKTVTSTSQAKIHDPTPDKTSLSATATVPTKLSPKAAEQRTNGQSISLEKSQSTNVINESNSARIQYESFADNITSQLKPDDSNTKPLQGVVKIEHEVNTGSPEFNQDDGSSGVKMAEDAPKFNSPPLQNSKTKPDSTTVKVKKENEKDDGGDGDMYSFLDWKDGIASLPGKTTIKLTTSYFDDWLL